MSYLRKAGVVMLECNHDCLRCPYPEMPEECLNEDVVYSEYEDLSRIEKELLYPSSSKNVSAEFREKKRERKRLDRKLHPEKANEYHLRWYRRNKDRVIAYAKEYRDRNVEKFSYQFCIRDARTDRGISQKALADEIGVAMSTVSRWESGIAPANWDKLCAALPDLERYKECVRI